MVDGADKSNWRADLQTSVSAVNFHPTQSEVLSITTDQGTLYAADLRVGASESKHTFISRVRPRRAGLYDHCWISNDELCLGYADGVLVKVDMRKGSMVSGQWMLRVHERSTLTVVVVVVVVDDAVSAPQLITLDSVEYMGGGRVAAFGDGGATLFDAAQMAPIAVFTPPASAFLGHGGCRVPDAKMFVSAADGSVFTFDMPTH